MKSLIKNKSIKYYLPETDFSIAHYFNEYLKNGDTILLKDLVTLYGIRVPQERTIEVYKKWQELKNIKKVLNWCYKAYGNKEPNNWLNGVAIAFMVLVALS